MGRMGTAQGARLRWPWQPGAAYARIVDWIRYYRHGAQRYGTLVAEVEGELVLLPLDGTATDADRGRFGLPPLAEVARSLLAENRRRAEALWARADLPPGVNVRRVAPPWSPQDLLSRWQREKAPVWADGDHLTFVYRGEAEAVDLIGGLQLPMWRVADSDVWAVTVRVRDLYRAALSYGFAPRASAVSPDTGTRLLPPTRAWRGPAAPPPPPAAATLRGALRGYEIDSRHLAERRRVVVYVPPGYNPGGGLPAVYLADGGLVRDFAPVLEPRIGRDVPPVLLVGVEAKPDPVRQQEYLPGVARRRFEQHHRFFVEEVRAWAEAQLGAGRSRERRAVFGASNGARFAVEVGLRHPEVYGTVIAFSMAGAASVRRAARRRAAERPRHYLVAGTLEHAFHANTARHAAALAAAGVVHVFRERVAGHDLLLWREEFPDAVAWAFRCS